MDSDTCTTKFEAALFTVDERKQPLSTDKGINKMWYIHHPVDNYSATKRNKVLTHATIWINLKNIMLSEITETQKDNYCMTPFMK